MENTTDTLEAMHSQLESLTCKAQQLEEEKAKLKKENKTAAAAVRGMNKIVSSKKAAKQSIRELEQKPEEVALDTKKKLKKVVSELKEIYTQIAALEQGIIEAQEALEFIESEECGYE